MNLTLTRYAYTDTEVQGELTDGTQKFKTIEKPWIKGPHLGGMSNKSCVPDGKYKLVPHTRAKSGEKVVALVNPKLGVWYLEEDRPEVWGRFLVLIHSGNFIHDIIGCIAPGLDSVIENNAYRTVASRAAMNKLKVQKYDTLIIKSGLGAND